MKNTELLRTLILSAVANDYEDWSTVAEEVIEWSKERDQDYSTEEVGEELRQLIVQGLVAAYNLSPCEPFSREVNGIPECLEGVYFLVTQNGRSLLNMASLK